MKTQKTTSQLVKELKDFGEDMEFYPTTQEIVDRLADYLAENTTYLGNILDIGCGNGSFFRKLDETKQIKEKKVHINEKYGIEKSSILYEQVPEDVIMLGTDFHEQTLIDKKVDTIFSNPPYSEYEEWAVKIITEGNCQRIALVLPERWKESKRIKESLKKRKMEATTLGTFDFSQAERKARAKTELVMIEFKETDGEKKYYRGKEETDPFDIWFEENFKINADKTEFREYEAEEKKEAEIIEKGDTAEMLVKFYQEDMKKLHDNYRALEKLDPAIFRELKVNVKGLKKSLKMRINGLKNTYWKILFNKYDRITRRITSERRRKVINKLNGNTAIDFTLENIFQITMWLIRNSNKMFDDQLSDFFLELCNPETIHRYKSNLRWNEDEWRYIKVNLSRGHSHYEQDYKKSLKNIQLDYRIIVKSWGNWETDYEGKYRDTMTDSCIEFLDDIYIIAENLGFEIERALPVERWNAPYDRWNNFDIYYRTKDGEWNQFANVKLYKNGNRHIKFCQEFMRKLNVEMARINKWIQDKSEASKEMEIPIEEISEIWGTTYKLLPKNETGFLGLPSPEEMSA